MALGEELGITLGALLGLELGEPLGEELGLTLGLALGGGAVKGAAHMGVLQAFEEADLRPDFISGTSIGAMVGTLYAFGKTPQQIVDLAT